MKNKVIKYQKNMANGIAEIEQFLLRPEIIPLDMPPKHSFSPGIYVRELELPEGTLAIGKVHKHRHHLFLMKGAVIILTEANGVELLQAPLTIVSEPGTQRVAYAITDTILVTVHPNEDNTEDMIALEEKYVVNDKNKYIEYKNNLTKKIAL